MLNLGFESAEIAGLVDAKVGKVVAMQKGDDATKLSPMLKVLNTIAGLLRFVFIPRPRLSRRHRIA